MDGVRGGRVVELDTAARHHVAAGLLGPHRAGLRALVRIVEGEPEQPAVRHLHGGLDRADAGTLCAPDAVAQVWLAGAVCAVVPVPWSTARIRRLSLPFPQK